MSIQGGDNIKKRKYPAWVKKARIKIDIEKHISRKELAEKLGINYTEMCDLLNGNRQNEKNHIRLICDYLNIKYEE